MLMGGLGVGLVRLVGGEVRGVLCYLVVRWGSGREGGVVEIPWWDSWILVFFLERAGQGGVLEFEIFSEC